MNDSLQLIKNDATKSDVKVSELLRRAKIFAKEAKLDSAEWITDELEGYGRNVDVPDYRIVRGEPKGWNPYNGWIPFIISDPVKQEAISKRGVSQPIAELESLVADGNLNSFEISYPEDIQKQFGDSVGMSTRFSLHISPTSIWGVLNAVRNKLIDWLIGANPGNTVEGVNSMNSGEPIFPDVLIEKLPQDVKILADDFNFRRIQLANRTMLTMPHWVSSSQALSVVGY